MNFGFLVFAEAEELDFVGPWEMIRVWGKYSGGPEHALIVSETGGTLKCAKGLRILSDYSFENCPRLDYLLIPGGQGTRQEVSNTKLLEFVRTQAASCRQILSVCTGSFILQAAGLLQGKQATTHWASLNRLRDFTDVKVMETRFVRDGNIWSAAGVSAGIDLALALIADQAGEEIAGEVQLYAEYYPNAKKYGTAHRRLEAPSYVKC